MQACKLPTVPPSGPACKSALQSWTAASPSHSATSSMSQPQAASSAGTEEEGKPPGLNWGLQNHSQPLLQHTSQTVTLTPAAAPPAGHSGKTPLVCRHGGQEKGLDLGGATEPLDSPIRPSPVGHTAGDAVLSLLSAPKAHPSDESHRSFPCAPLGLGLKCSGCGGLAAAGRACGWPGPADVQLCAWGLGQCLSRVAVPWQLLQAGQALSRTLLHAARAGSLPILLADEQVREGSGLSLSRLLTCAAGTHLSALPVGPHAASAQGSRMSVAVLLQRCLPSP